LLAAKTKQINFVVAMAYLPQSENKESMENPECWNNLDQPELAHFLECTIYTVSCGFLM